MTDTRPLQVALLESLSAEITHEMSRRTIMDVRTCDVLVQAVIHVLASEKGRITLKELEDLRVSREVVSRFAKTAAAAGRAPCAMRIENSPQDWAMIARYLERIAS